MLDKGDIERQISDWRGVIHVLTGVSLPLNKGIPCPLRCGSENDGFTYSNKYGRGDYYCRKCASNHGDGWSFISKYNNWTFGETVKRVAEHMGMKQDKKIDDSSAPIIPAPPLVYKPGDKLSLLNKDSKSQQHSYTHFWAWLNQAEELIGYIGRKPDKVTHQIYYTQKGWAQGSMGNGKPLFGLQTLKSPGPVYVVEGEKAWQAVCDQTFDVPCVTWVGGANNVKNSNWLALKGRELILCPDNDEQGRKAMEYVRSLFPNAKWFECPSDEPGWDLADYEGDDIEAFVSEHTRTAEELIEEREEQDTNTKNALYKYIRPLGFDHKKLFFMPTGKLQVIELNMTELGKGCLRALAPMSLWREAFPKMSKQDDELIDWDVAADWVIRECERKKVYDQMNIRGNGVWRDKNDVVVHMGDHLLVNGIRTELNNYDSKYVYAQRKLKIQIPKISLLRDEKQLLIDIAESLRFVNRCSSTMLLSFILLSPLSAYWDWRASIWIRGPKGMGKSTILEKFVTACIEHMSMSFEGATTEAGIRQSIGCDAMGVIFDEPEADSHESNRQTEAILKFIRSNASSSSSLIAKGSGTQTAVKYQAMCMFLLASINTVPMKPQDKDRITCLDMQPNPEGDNNQHWKHLEGLLNQIPKDVSQKLFYFMVSNIHWVEACVNAFRDYVSKKANSRRVGDQFGTLMVGKYLLEAEVGTVPSEEEIESYIDDSVWSMVGENQEVTNEDNFIDYFLGVTLKVEDKEGKTKDRTILELLELIRVPKYSDAIEDKEAIKSLNRKGIHVIKNEVHFAKNSHHLSKLFYERPEFMNYTTILKRLKFAQDSRCRLNGTTARTIAVPVEIFLERSIGEEEIQW